MKKKILFIISNMESGGVSKSMSSLLNVVDTEKYEVDCFVLSPQGVFMSTIPQSINIITDKRTTEFLSNFPKNLIKLITKGYLIDVVYRIAAAFFMFFNKGIGGWLLSRRIRKIDKKYDLAVDFNGQQQLYYLIDKINAQKKVTFFHSDYEKWSYYYSMDKKYLPLANNIFTISEKCVETLRKKFPESKDKIGLFENISSAVSIKKMATEKITDSLDINVLKLITIGHLCENKGTSLALNAAKILKNKKIDFKWYFIGQNLNYNLYEEMIVNNNLVNEIIFMGLKSNPYPYIQQADIVVHPSLFEGKSIALDEAKILCKPVVVTNFSTVKDQFTDRVNGSICEMNPVDIADKILELYQNEDLKNIYINYLRLNSFSNEGEIEKIYKLIH